MQIAELMLRSCPPPVYCLKQIVHNPQVIDSLTAQGMRFVQDITDVPRGSTLLFSAHGIPPSTRDIARDRELRTVDATCPFVTKVHGEVRQYARKGYSILLIGHHRHDEIIGVAGEAPEQVQIVASEAEARAVMVPDPGKVAVLTQTTLSLDEVASTLAILRERFPALKTPPEDDICYATRNRQQAVREYAGQTDAFVVLGAENSSNSNRLVEVARANGHPAYLASSLERLDALPLDTLSRLGVTAGASTPEAFVQAALQHLRKRGFGDIEDAIFVREDLHFALPRELADLAHRKTDDPIPPAPPRT